MKNEQDKEYLEFVTGSEDVPAKLNIPMKKEIGLSIHGTKIFWKFFALQVAGGLFSLYFCPQFGIGKESARWHHYFMSHSETTCTITCATFFLCCSIFFSTMALKGEEWWWLYRRRKSAVILYPAMFWGLLMFTRLTIPSFRLESPEHSFTLWFSVAALAQFIWMFGRVQVYRLSAK